MIEYIIRRMTESDLDVVLKYDMVMLGETLGEDLIKEHLQSDIMKYFIMENKENSDFIGMISVWIDEDKAQINNFYIIHKYQNQGFGKKMMDYMIYYFNTINICEITLEVRESNFVAINFYEKYRFKQVSVRKNYYKNGEDALLMYSRIGSD